MTHEAAHITVDRDSDIVAARQKGRDLAARVGFTGSDLTIIATAISEIARNIVVYAQRGEIDLSIVEEAGRRGIARTISNHASTWPKKPSASSALQLRASRSANASPSPCPHSHNSSAHNRLIRPRNCAGDKCGYVFSACRKLSR